MKRPRELVRKAGLAIRRHAVAVVREVVSDSAIVAGAVAVVWGIWQVDPAAGWIAGGGIVGAFGYVLGRRRK